MVQVRVKPHRRRVKQSPASASSPLRPEQVMVRPRLKPQPAKDTQQSPIEREGRKRLARHKDDPRFQRELEEMQELHDLDEIDDDVEAEATLMEWRAYEHVHRPKAPMWFALFAGGTTVAVVIQMMFFNFFGALTIGVIGALVYAIAQEKPRTARYRIMLDGIAINNTLYHWRDLSTFNVIYEPDDEVKTVIFRGTRLLAPHMHMEIGDANPVAIRQVLMEFLEEDQDMDEPLVDVLARRLGF